MIEYIDPKKSRLTTLIRKHPDFIGREDVLEFLEKDLIVNREEWKPLSEVKVRLLWGLGGMGKSETAIAFANDHLFDFSFIWTIDCEKELAFEYRLLGDCLGVPFEKETDPEKVVDMVHAFLNTNQYQQPWLLIYDNVESRLIEKDLPKRGGAVLLTSRQSNTWSHEGEKKELECFSKDEALKLLTEITGEPKDSEMELLAKDLEYFPFALNQVARYIKTTDGSSVEKYRKIYKLKHQALEAPIKSDGRYERVLKNVWATTFETIGSESPHTLEWLKLCSYLHPKDIPRLLLDVWTNNEAQSEEVSNVLKSYSLMRFNITNQSSSIHRLMQQVIRSGIENEDLEESVLTNCFDLFLKQSSENQPPICSYRDFKVETIKKLSLIFPHVSALEKHAEGFQELTEQRKEILITMGSFLYHKNLQESISFSLWNIITWLAANPHNIPGSETSNFNGVITKPFLSGNLLFSGIYLEKAVALIKDPQNSIGVYKLLGYINLAFKKLEKANSYFLKIDDRTILGLQKMQQGSFNEAEIIFKKELDRIKNRSALIRPTDRSYFIGCISKHLGELYLDKRDSESAIVNLREAKEAFNELYGPINLLTAECYFLLSRAYGQLNHTQNQKKCMTKSLETYKKTMALYSKFKTDDQLTVDRIILEILKHLIPIADIIGKQKH